ncbi:MAG: GUN4 domain-containing protein [Pseudanabaenaceae cyanobacterium]
MSEPPKIPQPYDAVRSETSHPGSGSLVLGGWAALQKPLRSPVPSQRVAALQQALRYGERGLDALIRALRDDDPTVRQTAIELLRQSDRPRAKQALALFPPSGMVYATLQTLLQQGRWFDANCWTKEAIAQLCGTPRHRRLNPKAIAAIPWADLWIADRLWRCYSQNRFGFSVQRQIWRQCAAQRWDRGMAWILFGERVGWGYTQNPLSKLVAMEEETFRWKRETEITFRATAPVGHLPYIDGIFTVEAFAARWDEDHPAASG